MTDFERMERINKLRRIQERLKVAIIVELVIAIGLLMFVLIAVKQQVFQEYEKYCVPAFLIIVVGYISLKYMWFTLGDAISSLLEQGVKNNDNTRTN